MRLIRRFCAQGAKIRKIRSRYLAARSTSEGAVKLDSMAGTGNYKESQRFGSEDYIGYTKLEILVFRSKF